MAPLEDVLEKPGSKAEPRSIVGKPRRTREANRTKPRAPDKFKVVDVMTREVLAEGATTSETVELLEGIRSIVDVRMYVWDDKTEKWRLLVPAQEKALWSLRSQS
jgi:hypothetical protein